MKKSEFKQFLGKRYTMQITEKLIGYFDFIKPWSYNDFVNVMELLIYQNDETFFKIVSTCSSYIGF